MPHGHLCLVLHAHLPFIRHPEHESFLEEDWLFEAITETYIPLLRAFDRLTADRVPFRVTMTLSPTLCEMLADPLLQERYRARLGKLRELVDRAPVAAPFRPAMEMYRRLLAEAERTYERECGGRLLDAFRRLQDSGALEIITCGATHAYLPNVLREEARRAQIRVAAANYRKHFGRAPRGIWLPECGYAPGVDRLLAEQGIRFFFLDAHGILNGSRVPKYGVHAPAAAPAGVLAFARDLESSKQVWSAKEGYPGDASYREFYRDFGYDAEESFIRPYLHPDGVRRGVGIKLHRITGDVPLHAKEPYDPARAGAKAAEHAANFHFNRAQQARHLRGVYGRAPVVVAPYDAELFGHWWFEGPWFLEHVFRRLAAHPGEVEAATPASIDVGRVQTLEPSMSSWGDKGYSEVWLNGSNEWLYRHQHRAADRMIELARSHPDAQGLQRRALNQAAREFLLAQSSDWAFILATGSAVPYAHRRFKLHIDRFTRLWEQVGAGRIDEGFLRDCESKDSIFQEIDYRAFA
jgi:1,4-alpha-glucan branching enzyme